MGPPRFHGASVYNNTNVPAKIIHIEHYNDLCGKVFDIDAYFGNEDQQTYGLVQLEKESKKVWVRTESLFPT